jgi:hypothetical protein
VERSPISHQPERQCHPPFRVSASPYIYLVERMHSVHTNLSHHKTNRMSLVVRSSSNTANTSNNTVAARPAVTTVPPRAAGSGGGGDPPRQNNNNNNQQKSGQHGPKHSKLREIIVRGQTVRSVTIIHPASKADHLLESFLGCALPTLPPGSTQRL